MQTFLPYVDYEASARVLDRQCLGQQRVENLQIMTALLKGTGWVNHPATLMWRRYEWALMQYQRAICKEWTGRGYKDTCWEKTEALYKRYSLWVGAKIWPYWSQSERLHLTHQSVLLQKDYTYYIQYFPGVPIDMEMFYPEPASDYMRFDPAPWWEPPESI